MAITSNWSNDNSAFTLAKMLEMVKQVPPRMDGLFGPSLFRDITRSTEPRQATEPNFFGMPIVENRAFPFQAECAKCEGTGEGADSTYCPKCAGAGENRYEGMVRNGDQTILLTSSLPKKFAPYFPRGAVASPPFSRGLV